MELHLAHRQVLRHVVLVLAGLQQRIDRDLEGLVKHGGNDALQEHAWGVEARIRIDLNQVKLEIALEHEVEAKQLKCVVISRPSASAHTLVALIRAIEGSPGCFEHVSDHIFDLWHYC